MLAKEKIIELIIERGIGVLGEERMYKLSKDSGINIANGKMQTDNVDESYYLLTNKFAAIAPTTRVTLIALSKIYGFELKLEK